MGGHYLNWNMIIELLLKNKPISRSLSVVKILEELLLLFNLSFHTKPQLQKMVDAIVSLAVEKLDYFITREVTLFRGVKEDVEWLRDELQNMQSFLRDADEKKGGDNRIHQWVSEIIEISYDAADILERVKAGKVEAPKSGIMGCLLPFPCICNKPVHLHNIAKEIESLKKKMFDISKRREAYGIISIGHSGEGTSDGQKRVVAGGPISRRRTTSYAHDEYVIGLEDVATTLTAELLKEGSSRSIVSIYGMGGLGKTTLARKLYNSLKVVQYFDCQAWICVSQEYRIHDLLRSIIKSFKGALTKKELSMLAKMTEEDLENYLRDFLEGRRYLVVVDDVWHEDAWKSLSRAFPDDKNGSRVIITTRNEEVAKRVDDKRFVYKLRFLTPTESWDLFCRKACQGVGEVNSLSPAMKSIAEEMVGRCQGLPLAIIVLAGLLSYKEGLEEWCKVQKNIWRQLKKDSIEIPELLTLSYNDLPLEIKQCFLYIGMFPEDYVFRVDKLIRLWIAEDLINPYGEEVMEDVAEEYLNELINRSLIQVAGRFWEKIVTCRVHDLLRDLAIEKAKEVKLFDTFDPNKLSSFKPLAHRRHAVHGEIEEYVSLHHSNFKMRTLLFTSTSRGHRYVENIELTCMKYKLLRVLDLKSIKLDSNKLFDNMIGNLILLKFLGLSDTFLREIPSSIGNLSSLQTLDLVGDFTCKLPLEMCKLKELRHLHGFFEGHLHIESLTNLLTLGDLNYDQLLEISPKNLSNVRELGLRRYSIDALHLIADLQNLDTLIFSADATYQPIGPLSSCKSLLKLWLYGPLSNVPTLNDFPPLLSRLILSNSRFTDDPMPVLERLPNLRSLELIYAYEGKKMVCSATGFCQLEVLRVSGLEELEEWDVEQGAFPSLKGLRIHQCDKLKTVPERLKFVPTVGKSESIYFGYNYHG